MNSKWYWLIRQKYRNLKFQIKKAAFRLNERKESSERLSSFSRIVIRTLLVQVAVYNKDNPINQNPAMLSFINNNLALISVYWGVKEKIHYDSFWYRSETQYKKWHTATDTEISLALNTGVSLQAMSVIKNRWWFEQDLLRINNICVEKLCAENDLNTLYSYLNIVAQLSSQAMESGCLLFWTKSVVDLQEKILPACIACAKSDDKNHVILAAAIADVFIGIYINIIIGINKYLRELNIDSLLNCATEAYSYEQLKPNNRYYNNHSVEHLFNCIFAELKLESKRVTPDWYIKQAVAYTVYQDLNDVVDAMDKIYNNVFSVGKRLTENKCYLQGATVLSRLFELSSKASMALTSLNTFFPKLEALHFEPTVVWDECHLKQFLTRRKEIEKRFPPYLVKCCGETTLAHWRDREDFPDSLGFCYNQLCEYLVVAIEDDDFESFKSAYSGFFGVVLLYHEYVRSDVVMSSLEAKFISLVSKKSFNTCSISLLSELFAAIRQQIETTQANIRKSFFFNCIPLTSPLSQIIN